MKHLICLLTIFLTTLSLSAQTQTTEYDINKVNIQTTNKYSTTQQIRQSNINPDVKVVVSDSITCVDKRKKYRFRRSQ